MPRGVTNAYIFQLFNSCSWSLIIGTPMLLFLKGLGAPAAVLGAALAMTPLFAALQIPAAGYVEKIGHKNFVVRGWAARSIFILGIAVVALLPERVSPHLRISLTMLMMGCFAAARGVSVCGLMPWITQIVPEPLRGVFIARDAMCMFLALTGTMLLSSWFVGAFPSVRAFGFLFIFSYLSALASVVFLRRIPDIRTTESRVNKVPPPWKQMIFYPPFFRFVRFNVVYSFFTAALGVIWVPFMKDGLHLSESLILVLSSYAFIVCAGVSLITGPISDRTGSRPLMAFASALIMLSQMAWMLVAAGVLPCRTLALFMIVTIGSIGYPILGMTSTRLLMGLIPATGRSHFFAISNVAVSLTMGVMPIVWGFALDGLGRLIGNGFAFLPGWSWNRYSLFYAMILTGTLSAQFLRHRLDEPRAMSTDEFLRLLLHSPLRLLTRVLTPWRNFFLPGGG